MRTMKIANLDDLRKNTDNKTVDMIVTQYMMEAIARNNILKELEKDLKDMNDTDMISAADLKRRIEEYNAVNGDLFND